MVRECNDVQSPSFGAVEDVYEGSLWLLVIAGGWGMQVQVHRIPVIRGTLSFLCHYSLSLAHVLVPNRAPDILDQFFWHKGLQQEFIRPLHFALVAEVHPR